MATIHSAWVRSMADRAGSSVVDLALRAGLSPDYLLRVAAGEATMEPPHMTLVTMVVLDGYDARLEMAEMARPPRPAPGSLGHWVWWARNGERRRQWGQTHVTLQDLQRRTGIDEERLAAVEREEATLGADEIREIASTLGVPEYQTLQERLV